MTDLSGRLASGDTLYGTFLGLGSALAAEACALAGFDWLLVDLEHGGGDESELLPQQLAADAHAVPMLVRVRWPAAAGPRWLRGRRTSGRARTRAGSPSGSGRVVGRGGGRPWAAARGLGSRPRQ